ncbi:MAG: cysteine--tRNA ligase [Candidatus Neomarinimicrobiota bacterium]|jgi:cysteinyl-tRNA synthetase|nr:cysteine--tRNA ligase [Candidatus Neomarinimicrobiota bacterium]HPN74190.1 cysteine--tRNA ligase [Candidatus Neomarinimicrobiota bacterium]HPX99745.1 cysteine--tRNA ligase [Candidatus Neomarinimicrobiota bacterium]HQC61536.1 cysteine--tRNA ligase [Candidatus Neomarinimicrobiota bacterium]
MSIYFYNTLSRQKEEFRPIEEGVVRLYTCGPTVYNFAHIGNYRAFVFEDLLRRFLKFKGFRVIQVMNITDVDDKIITAANREGVSIREFTEPFRQAFMEDLTTLGIEPAEYYPRATEHINEMVALIETLLKKGVAYRSEDGSIYFKVSEFPRYGQLANLNVTEMRRGDRVANDSYEKEEIRDFALWKAWKPEDGAVFWETSLGKGRPGWHIECSAMSMKYLGRHFDIHTGGVDNIFPHHENEIAQSEAATGEKFVNYWMHCEFLLVNDEKMSKSIGNIIYLRDLVKKGYNPTAIRLTLLGTHYRQKLNFSFEKLEESGKIITRLRDFKKSLEGEFPMGNAGAMEIVEKGEADFEAALDDDLNISNALAAVFKLLHEINLYRQKTPLTQADVELIRQSLKRIDSVLNILPEPLDMLSEEERKLIDARNQARRERNWAEADRLRNLLLERGIILEDTPKGTTWKRKI